MMKADLALHIEIPCNVSHLSRLRWQLEAIAANAILIYFPSAHWPQDDVESLQDGRPPKWVAEKFAETLEIKNKAYDALVQKSNEAAAKRQQEEQELKQELKLEADRQRKRIKQLLVCLHVLQGFHR